MVIRDLCIKSIQLLEIIEATEYLQPSQISYRDTYMQTFSILRRTLQNFS